MMDLDDAYKLAFDLLTQPERYGAFREEDHPRDEEGKFVSIEMSRDVKEWERGGITGAPRLTEEQRKKVESAYNSLPAAIRPKRIHFAPSLKSGSRAFGINVHLDPSHFDRPEVIRHEMYHVLWNEKPFFTESFRELNLLGTIHAFTAYKGKVDEKESALNENFGQAMDAITTGDFDEFSLEDRKAVQKWARENLPDNVFDSFKGEPLPDPDRYAADPQFITVGGHAEGDKKHVGGHAIPVDKLDDEKKTMPKPIENFPEGKTDSRGKWVGGDDGMVHVYHGTNSKNEGLIKSHGLKNPEGTGPGYYMITSSYVQAKAYAIGQSGDRVIHFSIPAELANKFLGRGQEHDVYEVKAKVAGLTKGILPSEYIVSELHDDKEDTERYAAGSGFVTVGGHEEGDKKHVDGHVIPVSYLEEKGKKDKPTPPPKEEKPVKESAVRQRKRVLIDALRPIVGDKAEAVATDIGLSLSKNAIAYAIRKHGPQKDGKQIEYNEALKLVPSVTSKLVEHLKEHDIPLPDEAIWKVEEEKKPDEGPSEYKETQDQWKKLRKEKADADRKFAEENYKKPPAPETVTSQQWVAIKNRQAMEEVEKDRDKLEKMRAIYNALPDVGGGEMTYEQRLERVKAWDDLYAKPATKKLLKKYRPPWSESKDTPSFNTAYNQAQQVEIGLKEAWKRDYISDYNDRAVKAKAEHLKAIQEAVNKEGFTLPDNVAQEFMYESWLPKKYRDNETTKSYIQSHETYMKNEFAYNHGLMINALGHASEELNSIMDKAGPPKFEAETKELHDEHKALKIATANKLEALQKYGDKIGTRLASEEEAEELDRLANEHRAAVIAEYNAEGELAKKQRELPKKWVESFFDHGGNPDIDIGGGGHLDEKSKENVKEAVAFLRKIVSPKWGKIAPVKIVPVGDTFTRANHSGDEIRTFTSASTWMLIHEYGHHIEAENGNSLGTLSKAFAMAAVKDHNQTPKHMGPNYEPYEIGAEDGFQRAYTGKFYDHESSEVLSMGVQNLYEDPVAFYEKAPAHFRWTIAALNGLLT